MKTDDESVRRMAEAIGRSLASGSFTELLETATVEERRSWAAGVLRSVANLVEVGQVRAFDLGWDGGCNIKSSVTLNGAIDFVTVRATFTDDGDGGET